MGAIGVVIHLIRQRITRQPVVADKAQVVPRAPLVGNRQPATAQQRDLVIQRNGRLGEFHGQ